jgi:outer membrane protein OmpA-like peptidoglycan-associated protein
MFRQEEQQENHFWMSYTDLVTGFLIIFIIVMLILYTRNNEQYAVDGTYGEMESTLTEQLKKIGNVEFSEQDTIRFIAEDNQSLFESNKYEITPYFKRLLDKTIPIYLNELYEIYSDTPKNILIKEVRIEGHTDSEGNYYENLKLSSNRARIIQEYIMKSKFYEKHTWEFRVFIQQHFIACGYSESIPLDKDGIITNRKNENKKNSRRVEFRVLLEYQKED